jgi:hypothetical protein
MRKLLPWLAGLAVVYGARGLIGRAFTRLTGTWVGTVRS